ncbi:MAG: hypothetical protein HZB26_22910, partial [Candidatus Hydrogenedentes bacterium]|nr:hypothetical protein [Candidatus Hydrogenedentota bacterium]
PSTVYLGGGFSYVGPNNGHGVPLDIATGLPVGVYPKVNDTVCVCVADGSGGWYIGGLFTVVGNVARNHIAHILADGSVDAAWNPNAPSPPTTPYPAVVETLLVAGDVIYVGGTFSSIGGQPRNGLAALDRATGLATDWNPDAATWHPLVPVLISTLALSGNTVYVGGGFVSIGGQTRNGLAALDTSTGLATDWDPKLLYDSGPIIESPGGIVTLAVSGGVVYVAGAFQIIGGQARNGLAALDVSTGLATAWDPNVANAFGPYAPYTMVRKLVVSGNVVYAGGMFTDIGGQARNNLAAINVNTGLATSWNPDVSGGYQPQVTTLAVSDNLVYVAGDFTHIGSVQRNYVAALDAATGLPTDWAPAASGPVTALAASGNVMYMGGSFASLGGRVRNNIAALDAATGMATNWDPNAAGGVSSMVVSGGALYVGGSFTAIGGQIRDGLASLDMTTGLATAWNPGVSQYGVVSSMVVSGSRIYVGGDFTRVGGQPRNSIAALDCSTGLATAWNPNPDFGVYGPSVKLALLGDVVYVAGGFKKIGGQNRNYLAALDATSGVATPWNPNPDAGGSFPVVQDIAVSDDAVYAAGAFHSVGGQARNGIAALDPVTGLATGWDANPTGNDNTPQVYKLTVSGGVVYAAGWFSNIGGQDRKYLAGLDAATGLATDWSPNFGFSGDFPFITAVGVSPNAVYVGGYFTDVAGQARSNFAEFDTQTPVSSDVFVSSIFCLDPSITSATSLRFAVWFSEAVTGVDVSDFALTTTGEVSGASVTSVEGSGALYTVRVHSGTGNGTIRLDVVDDDSIVGAATSLPLGGAGLVNGDYTMGQAYTIDRTAPPADTAPSVTLGSPAPALTNAQPIPVTVNFSEAVTGFTASDIAAGNATVTDFMGSGASYTFNLLPSGQGVVTADIASGVAKDSAGHGNSAAAQFSRVFDSVPPEVIIGEPSEVFTLGGAVTYPVTYIGADTVMLSRADVTLIWQGSANAAVDVSGSGSAWTVTLKHITGNGWLAISIAARTAVDAAGNSAPAAGPGASFLVFNTALEIGLASPTLNTTCDSRIPVTVTFTKPVAGFTADSMIVSNASVANFSGDGAVYTFDLIPNAPGAVTVQIPDAVAIDSSGNGNLASPALTRTYDPAAPDPDILGDGQVNAVDVQLVINKALGLAIGGDADTNHDGTVDALDVQLVINFSLGLTF